MFAFLAAILWFLVSIGIGHLGPVLLGWLGATCVALHLAFGSYWPPFPNRR